MRVGPERYPRDMGTDEACWHSPYGEECRFVLDYSTMTSLLDSCVLFYFCITKGKCLFTESGPWQGRFNARI